MDKQILAITAIFLTVVGSVTGVLTNQINGVQAEQNKRAEIIYAVPQLEKKIDNLDDKLDNINDKLDSFILSRSQTSTKP